MAAPCARRCTSSGKCIFGRLLSPVGRARRHGVGSELGGDGSRLLQRRSIILYRDHLDTPQKANHFVSSLQPSERTVLLQELRLIQDKLDTSTDKGETVPPTAAQLKLVMFNNAMPFIGFGIFDNAIMLLAGDYIDGTIGATLGITVLAAAGLGNLVSDVAGVGLAGYVEILVAKVGMKTPELRPEQIDHRKTRWLASLGRAIGVSIGCLLGMFPLLFMAGKKKAEEEDPEPRS